MDASGTETEERRALSTPSEGFLQGRSTRVGRLVELAVGYTVNKATVWGFDYLLYPFVIWKLGPWHGGLVMMGLSFVVCILTIWFYDWAKRDWLGIEMIKGMKTYSGSKRLGKITSWFLEKSEPVVFLFLSFIYDPFITMVYLRRGAYNGMSGRDWRIFLVSFILGNLIWIFACWTGINLAEWVWRRTVGG